MGGGESKGSWKKENKRQLGFRTLFPVVALVDDVRRVEAKDARDDQGTENDVEDGVNLAAWRKSSEEGRARGISAIDNTGGTTATTTAIALRQCIYNI